MSPQSSSVRSSSAQNARPRLYIGTACDQCFRTKARCAGEKPVCGRCRRNDTPCTYSTGKRKRQPAKNEVQEAPQPSHKSSTASSSSTSIPQHNSNRDSPVAHLDQPNTEYAFQMNAQPDHLNPRHPAGKLQAPDSLSVTEPASVPGSPAFDINQPCDDLFEQLANGDSEIFGASSLALAGLPISSLESLERSSPAARREAVSQTFTQQQNTNTLDTSAKTSGLGQTLARLQAYLFDVSPDLPGDILAELQYSLSAIGACLSDAEASSKEQLSSSNPSSALPSFLGAVGSFSPVVAITCSHTVQLVFACYLKMRQLHKRATPRQSSTTSSASIEFGNSHMPADSAPQSIPPVQPAWGTSASMSAGLAAGFGSLCGEPSTLDSLLDYYITRDMHLCQSFAERVMELCRSLARTSQIGLPNQNQQSNEVSAAMETMIASLKVCTLMCL